MTDTTQELCLGEKMPLMLQLTLLSYVIFSSCAFLRPT